MRKDKNWSKKKKRGRRKENYKRREEKVASRMISGSAPE